MNPPSRPQLLVEPPAELNGSTIHLPNLWRAIRRARAWIVLTPLVVAVLVLVWTRWQEPVYEATASLVVETEPTESGPLARQVAAFTGLGEGRNTLETDLRLLASRQIAEGVVDSLALQVVMRRPRAPRSEIFARVAAERDAFSGMLTLERMTAGRYALEVVIGERSERAGFPLQESVGVGEAFEVGGVTLELAPTVAGEAPESIELIIIPFRDATQAFRNNLVVGRSGSSSVVEVTTRHSDPELAAGASNSVVERFVDYRRAVGQADARGAIDFLHDQVGQYELQLGEAEDELRRFREQELVVSPDAAATQQAQRLGTLEAQRAGLIAEQQVLARLVQDAAAAAGTEAGSSAYRRLAAYPEFFRNAAVQNILSSLVELENERSELLIRRTGENVDVRGLTSRIGELEEQLYLMATNHLAGLEEQIAAVDRTLAGSAGQAERVPGVQAEYMRLTRQLGLLEEIYTLLQTRLKEQEVAEADSRSDIRTLDAALVPLRPASPRPMLNLVLALIIGSMLGIGIAVVRALFDPAIYSRETAVAAAGGVPILTSIPDTRETSSRLLPSAGRRTFLERALPGRGAASNGRSTGPLADPAAEAYTDLRTRLTMFISPPPQVLVVTSPRAGDGKSTVAVNLALAYARHGTRTLLLEGDLRRPGLGDRLGTPAGSIGLGQVLQGSATAAEAILHHPAGAAGEAPLHLLLAGESPRHPIELLDSPALARLVQELRDHYAMIIIDTPPLSAVADALLLARVADGALLVTRAGATDRNTMEEAAAELGAAGVHVHGLVLNGFADRNSSRYSYGPG